MQTVQLDQYFETHQERILEEWKQFLRFPSISSDPRHKEDLLNCCGWIKQYLSKMGFETELWPTTGHPTLFASHMKAGADQPTLLIYGHYDVQPAAPLNEWKTPAFEPTIVKGEMIARGAQDNKGQCFYCVQAVKALLDETGSLPINVKFIIEGEEEIGSPGLHTLLDQKKSKLQADYLAVIDVGIPGKETPAVTLGVRGIAVFQLNVRGAKEDLHSGSHGGVVVNPCSALSQLISSFHDPKTGKIAIEGFYDSVQPLSDHEKEMLTFDFDAAEYEAMFGTKPVGGEREFSPLERAWIRPTLEINGMSAGGFEQGFKTIVPSIASATLSCRLVPNQTPEEISKLMLSHVEKHSPPGVQVDCIPLPGGGVATRSDPSSKGVQAFADAYTDVFQTPCRFIFEGGSIPVVSALAKSANADVILAGLGLADDQIHAPNEHFGVDRFKKGLMIIASAIEKLAK